MEIRLKDEVEIFWVKDMLPISWNANTYFPGVDSVLLYKANKSNIDILLLLLYNTIASI